jgi:hypothetical protein
MNASHALHALLRGRQGARARVPNRLPAVGAGNAVGIGGVGVHIVLGVALLGCGVEREGNAPGQRVALVAAVLRGGGVSHRDLAATHNHVGDEVARLRSRSGHASERKEKASHGAEPTATTR